MNGNKILQFRDTGFSRIRELSDLLEKAVSLNMFRQAADLLAQIEELHGEACNEMVDMQAQIDNLTEELRYAQDYIDTNF